MIVYKPSAGTCLRLQTLAMSCKDHIKSRKHCPWLYYKGRIPARNTSHLYICRQRLCYQDDPRPKDNHWPTLYVTMATKELRQQSRMVLRYPKEWTGRPTNQRSDSASLIVRTNNHTHSIHHAREHLKRGWTTLSRNSSQQGSWATANWMPPSLHSTPHFLALADRRAFGRLLQCRTGHSYSGEYYRRFVPSADPACPWHENTLSNPRTCEKHRTTIRKVSQMLYLPDLPGTMAWKLWHPSSKTLGPSQTKDGQSPLSQSTPHMTDRPLTGFT